MLDVPSLSLDGSPAEFPLPWPSSVTLEPQAEGEVHLTMSGLYELAPPADAESLAWSLTWDLLSRSELDTLERAVEQQALSFADPLGRPCQGQLSDLRSSIVQRALGGDGRVMYGASAQLTLFASSHLPWCPSFAQPNKSVLGVDFYGRVGPRDPLAQYGFIETTCSASPDGKYLIATGGTLTNWGALESPSLNWDRTARDGVASDPIPTTRLSAHHLSPRRGSFFFAFTGDL